MKKSNKLLSIILCAALILVSVSVNVVAATKPSVTSKLSLNVKQTKTIKVTGKLIQSKKFKSNKKSVATVSKTGKVTGKKAGTAKITVTVKYKKTTKSKKVTIKKYICTVTVKKPVVTKKPTVKPNPTATPKITDKPQVTTPVPTDTLKPQVTKTPDVTKAPVNSPKPTATPSATKTPDVPSETNKPGTVPGKKYDYTFYNGWADIGVVWVQYPSTTQKGIYDYYITKKNGKDIEDTLANTVEVPTLNDIITKNGIKYGMVLSRQATCQDKGIKSFYDLRDGAFSFNESIPPTGHTSDGIWHAKVSSNGEEGTIWNGCKNCKENLNEIKVFFKENEYAYGKWIQEPSETQEGILAIYKGVGIKDMSKEELAAKYDSYDVVFNDGTKDTYYGELVYKDNGEIQRFDVCAKSTAQQTRTMTFPKYKIQEIDLGNGKTTKVYGYYDTAMADEVYKLLNEYREQNGVPKLGTNDYMKSLADKRAPEEFYVNRYNEDNDVGGYIAHERPNHTMCWTVVGENGNLTYGENAEETSIIPDFMVGGLIQKPDYSANTIMQYFKNSREHNANMLDPDYGGVGISVFVGYWQNSNGTFRGYQDVAIVQSFMY